MCDGEKEEICWLLLPFFVDTDGALLPDHLLSIMLSLSEWTGSQHGY